MKKTCKRLLATVMTVIMVLGVIPFAGIDFGSIFASKASASENNIYSAYLGVINGINSSYSIRYYTTYDIDDDGVKELILKIGTSASDTCIYFYTYNGQLVYLGECNGFHSDLYGIGNSCGVYHLICHMGYEDLYTITIENNKIKETTNYKSKVIPEDSDYSTFDNYIEFSKLNNTQNLKKDVIYGDILIQYREAIKNNVDINSDLSDYNYLYDNFVRRQYYMGDSGIYYAEYDIDGNGTDEMILSVGNGPRNSIFSIFTFANGKIYAFHDDIENTSLGERSYLCLYENGTIVVSGSNGASYQDITLYKYGTDGHSPVVIDEFSYISYKFYQGKKQISESDLNNFIKNYTNSNDTWTKLTGNASVNYKPLYHSASTSQKVFNKNTYIANIWLNRGRDNTTSESKLINDLLSFTSVSSTMYEEAINDKNFSDALKLWKGMGAVFDPGKQVKELLSEKSLYETLILDLLERIETASSGELNNIILDAVETSGETAETVTKYKGIIDNLVGIVDNPDKMLLSVLKEWKFDPECTSFQNFYALLNNTADTTSKWTDSKFIKGIGYLADGAADIADFYKRFEGYLYVTDMADEMVKLLEEMYKYAEPDAFREALSDIIFSVRNTDYSSLVQGCELFTNLGLDVVNEVFDKFSEEIPVYGKLRAAYKAGVAFDDVFLNTSNIIDKFYLIQATYYFINADKDAVNALKNKYLYSGSDADAGAYIYAVKAYHYAYEIDLESALAFAKEATNEGLINYAKRGITGAWNFITGDNKQTSYQEMSESVDFIMKNLDQLFYGLDNSWKFNGEYLHLDYPDVFEIYLGDEISGEAYTPLVSKYCIEKSGKTNINWSLPYCFKNTDGQNYVLYGNPWINGIEATETIGTSKNSLSYNDVYSAPNPIQFYNSSKFSTFPKSYEITSFSTETGSKIYTPSTKVKLENPLWNVEIELAMGAEFLRRDKGVAITIKDFTASIYDFVKYKIYRKTDNGSWSLIKTVDRDFSLRGNETVFYDNTITQTNKYTYKVVSSITFDNGVTIKSGDSNELTINGPKKDPVVNNIRAERFGIPEPIPTPTPGPVKKLLKAAPSGGETGIKLSWDAIGSAKQYEIYRMSSFGTVYNLIATVDGSSLSYFDEDILHGVDYDYVVVPCSVNGDNKAYETNTCALAHVISPDKEVIAVSISDVTLNRNSTAKITPNIIVAGGAKYYIDWRSSNTSVVTIDTDGNVYGVDKGTAEIICRVKDETGKIVEDTCTVTVTEDASSEINFSSLKVGDIIEFGSYPQSKVTDSATASALDKISKSWTSYGYYSGTGDDSDGNMKPDKDMMYYSDISYNDNVYRAVKINRYRPYMTGYTSSASNSDAHTYQYDNGYCAGNVYYFKYEPLTWKVLDPSDGLVVCNKAIDSQAYNNYFLYYNNNNGDLYDDGYGNSSRDYYASDWTNSSLREWLNNDFYSTAFSSYEKLHIGTTHNENDSAFRAMYTSADTSDKIFLLSYNEVLNSKYGFSLSRSTNDPAKQIKSTDYAKCQGCWKSTDTSYYGNTSWWLRSPETSGTSAYVYYSGSASGSINAGYCGRGIVPAFKYKKFSNYTVTYNANGGSVSPANVTVEEGKSITLPTPTRSGYTCLGWSTSSTATSASYYCGTAYTPDNNVILYAMWSIEPQSKSEMILSQTNVSMNVGDEIKITRTATVPEETKIKYTYKNYGKDIVSYYGEDSTITLTALKAGTTKIEINLYNADTNEKLDTKTINVAVSEAKLAVKINLSSSIQYDRYVMYPIKPTVTIANGVEYTVKYESSNPSVAIVDKDGNITTLHKGDTTITCIVTDEYGNVAKDTCAITVKFRWWQWIIWILLFGFLWY